MEKIIVYDFDKTIYDGETSTDFMKFFLKRNTNKIYKFPYIFLSIFYYFIDLKKSKEYFFKILENIDIKYLEKEIDEFWKINKKKFFTYVESEIEKNKKEVKKLILISATPSIFLNKIYKELGFDKLIATEFVNHNKYFKSKIIGKNCKGMEKVKRLNEYIKDYEIISFYSDSMSDKPLFDLAKNKYFITKGVKEKI